MTLNNDKITKICVSSNKETLDSDIDPRFGRCEYFIIVDIDNEKILSSKAIKNIGTSKGSGAGISAAEQIGKLGVKILITGNIGPKAEDILNQLEIKVYKKTGTAKKAINDYINKTLIENNENTPSPNREIDNSPADQRLFIPLMEDGGENSKISQHFGHAPYFGLYDLSSKKLKIKENKLDHNSVNKTPVDQVIDIANPTIVFAQGMGARAISLFTEKNIALKTGPYNTLKEVIDSMDKLEDLTKGCEH